MDLLKPLYKELKKMAKQNGIATLLALGLIVGAFGVGLFFKHATDHVDHPVEEVVEDLLGEYNIDVDFSADKKKARD